MALNIGDFLSDNNGMDYEVKRLLGEGGFGKAWLVNRLSDGLECVAKEPKDLDKKLVKALNSEFTVLDNLEQKNVPYVVRAIAMAEYQVWYLSSFLARLERTIGQGNGGGRSQKTLPRYYYKGS